MLRLIEIFNLATASWQHRALGEGDVKAGWSSEEKKPRIVLPIPRHDSDLEDRRGRRAVLERLAGVEPDASSLQITALPRCDARDPIRARRDDAQLRMLAQRSDERIEVDWYSAAPDPLRAEARDRLRA